MPTPADPKHTGEPVGAVMLPCSQEHFRDFISGLLGKPQTLTKLVDGPFDITRPDLENLHHLVTQRVTQQNQGTLVQFTARLVFDDQSTVLVNSFDEFRTYTEIRPVVTTAAYLSWTFLIQFADREFPEKQEIQVSAHTKAGIAFDEDLEVHRHHHGWHDGLVQGFFAIRISHTARTWGADVEAMLSAQLETLRRSVPKWKRRVRRHSGRLSLAMVVGFVAAAIIGVGISGTRVARSQRAALASLTNGDKQGGVAVAAKIDYLVDVIASGVWPRQVFFAAIFLGISLIAGTLLAAFLDDLATAIDDPD